MNFLLFTLLPALIVGIATRSELGIVAFLILCAVWLHNLSRDERNAKAREQQDNALRDLANEVEILRQRVNQQNQTIQALLRQPENARQPENMNTMARQEHLMQPENLAATGETVRQPETATTNEFNLDALNPQPAHSQNITQNITQNIQLPTQPAQGQPETATSSPTPIQPVRQPENAVYNETYDASAAQPVTPRQPHAPRQPETAWQSDNDDAQPNPITAWFLRGNPLLKIGVVVLFFGLAFLLRYVGSHLPLWFKYAAVFGAGVAAALAGEKLHIRNREYGLVLQGFGFAVMYLTALAALKLHHILPAPIVFAVMLGAVVLMAALAVRRDAKIMAQVALAGGLAAPVLVSDGSGNYLVLFSYLSLLNTAVAWIAWHKAWRSLNLTGFVGTFAIALSWGLRDYTAAHFASTEPFLLYHWLLYTAVACFFARQTLAHEPLSGSLKTIPNDAPLERIMATFAAYASHIRGLDSTLLFGTALIAFSMQYQMVEHWQYAAAASALGFAAVYAGFALWFARQDDDFAVMKQAFAALALLFVTLAAALGLDGVWTASAWALEAALVYAFGMKLRQPHTRLAALCVFVLAAVAQWDNWQWAHSGGALLGGSLSGTLWLLGGGAAMVWTYARQPEKLAVWEQRFQAAIQALTLCNALALPMMLWGETGTAYAMAAYALAFAAAQFRWQNKVLSVFAALAGWLAMLLALFRDNGVLQLTVGVLALAAAFLLHKSRWQPENKVTLNSAAGWALLPFAALMAMLGVREMMPFGALYSYLAMWWLVWLPMLAAARWGKWRQGLQTCAAAGWLFAWMLFYVVGDWNEDAPVSISITFAMMTALSWRAITWQPEKARRSVMWHGIALTVFGVAWTCWLGNLGGQYASGVWAQLAWLAVPMLLWLAFTAWRERLQPKAVYWQYGSAVAAAVALAWLLWANWTAPRASSLPYLPLLNPLELATAAIVWQAWRWFGLWLPENDADSQKMRLALPSALALFAVSALVMRVWHEYGGVAWRLHELLASFGLQASLSIVWALLAIGLMVRGNQQSARSLWFTGASLMGVVVAKLFLVELGNSGGVARIVSFIVVGVLLLLVGWFAPMPPKDEADGDGDDEDDV